MSIVDITNLEVRRWEEEEETWGLQVDLGKDDESGERGTERLVVNLGDRDWRRVQILDTALEYAMKMEP